MICPNSKAALLSKWSNLNARILLERKAKFGRMDVSEAKRLSAKG
jgi:hypothetical protein